MQLAKGFGACGTTCAQPPKGRGGFDTEFAQLPKGVDVVQAEMLPFELE